MKVDEYQQGATTTAIYPGKGEALGLAYTALGLADEVGELVFALAETPAGQALSAETRAEFGDVQWYMAQIATEVGRPLSQVLGAAEWSVLEYAALPGTYLEIALRGTRLAGRAKKVIRDGADEATRTALLNTLMMYLSDIAKDLGSLAVEHKITLESTAEANLKKLADRAARGVIKGDGDVR